MSDADRSDDSPRIAAVPYQPAGKQSGGVRPRVPPLWIALGALGLVMAAAVLFFYMARSVQLRIEPAGARIDVDGGVGFALGSGYLLWPGEYRLLARAEGYEDLAAGFQVRNDPRRQSFQFDMTRLPGRLRLVSNPPAETFIDGTARGTTPLQALELRAGEYDLLLRAPRYQAYEARIEIEGGGVEQTLQVDLVPGWAPVSVRSQPPGATILIDGIEAGRTPQTLEVGAGAHEIALSLPGYATWRDRLTVTANEALALPEVDLQPAQGRLQLSSIPRGASVTVNGSFRGNTPLDLLLTPGRSHTLTLSAPGYRTLEHRQTVTSDGNEPLQLELQAILGSVVLDVQPADAKVEIDGEAVAPGTTEVKLTATAHRIAASKDGHEPWTGTVTPKPGFEQRVTIRLKTEAAAQAARNPARIASKGGPELVLIAPGEFTLGSARGTQGRQTNEALRPVKLSRAFYLATTEISNEQYRRFAGGHSSGIIRRTTLDNDRQPVARVSWNDAVRYCNWLSQQDGLPPAYESSGNDFALVKPVTTGYRLPSEAEWEWAARFAPNRQERRYPWGAAFPPPAGSGNFADASAQGIAEQLLPGYDDKYPAASPVGSFGANPLGLFDLGGNVAEWVHDAYETALAIDPPRVTDPFGPEPGSGSGGDRVIRGSSWLHGGVVQLRSAYRDFGREPRPDLGFRVARYAQ